jgi:hypothetical protein
MKKIILQLLKDIAALTVPINPHELKKLFDRYPEFNRSNPPLELEIHWGYLIVLHQLGVCAYDVINQLQHLITQQHDFIELTQEQYTLEQRSADLTTQIQECINKLSACYKNIANNLTDSPLKDAPSLPPYHPDTPPEGQIKFVEEHLNQILQVRRNICINTLHDLGVNCKTNDYILWESKRAQLCAQQIYLLKLEPKLTAFTNKCGAQLTQREVQLKIKDIEQQQKVNSAQRVNVQKKLAETTLTNAIKDQLINEFKGHNYQELITQNEASFDIFMPTFQLQSWLDWYNDPQYSNRPIFLQLLQEQHHLELKNNELASSLQVLNTLSLKEEAVSPSLNANAITLINKLPKSMTSHSLEPTSPIIDFYLNIISAISTIGKQIKQINLALLQIDELVLVVNELKQLGMKDVLSPNNQESTTSSQQNEMEVLQIRDALIQQQLLCRLYKDQAKTYKQLMDTHNEYRRQIKINEISLSRLLPQLMSIQIALLANKLTIRQPKPTSSQINALVKKSITLLSGSTPTEIEELDDELITILPKLTPEHIETLANQFIALPPEPSCTQCVTLANQLSTFLIESLTNQLTPLQRDISLKIEQIINLPQSTAAPTELAPVSAPEPPPIPDNIPLEPSVITLTDSVVAISPLLIEPPPVFLPSASQEPRIAVSSVRDSNTTHQELVTPIIQVPQEGHPLLKKIEQWHQSNVRPVVQFPVEIQEWYSELYNGIKTASSNQDLYYKLMHLMRDISFELQMRKEVSTLSSYKRMCPNPIQSIDSLLALKPNLPISKKVVINEVPLELQPLYAHYIKLKAKHPIEAKLFFQAFQSLYLAIQQKDESHPGTRISRADMPLLSQDPRYAPLKRHRGFFKIWEMLVDFCRMIIGKISGQAEYEYTNKPCFFKPYSSQLLEKADLLVRTNLPGTAA